MVVVIGWVSLVSTFSVRALQALTMFSISWPRYYARPEQVDEAVRVVQAADMLLIARHGAAADAEDRKELVVEALRFAALVGRVGPLRRESDSAGADFIPRKAHDEEFGVPSSRRALETKLLGAF